MRYPESAVRELPYAEALAETESLRRHLLLGNGFSVSLHNGFRYNDLYEVAISDRSIAFLFNELGVFDRNFEEALAKSADDAQRGLIRRALIAAVIAVHPKSILTAALDACGQFLSEFSGPHRGRQRGSIFTTNYDLLLYRVAIRNREQLRCYDAFDSDGFWHWRLSPTSQIFYLHGGIHIFRRDIRPLPDSTQPPKSRYVKLLAEPADPLMVKIARHLASNDVPVFVSEGTASEKAGTIGQHDYLRKVHRHFARVCKSTETTLFTVGHSLNEVDEHIVDRIGRSELRSVYVGAFGQADRERVAQLAVSWAQTRREMALSPMQVCVFDTRDCPIWTAKAARIAA